MPNYEYQCTQCARRFEIWQSVGEAAPDCPECGSRVKKVFHPPRVIFKGSGFYVTDLRAEKEKAKTGSAKSESNGAASSESPASGSGVASTSSTSGDAAPGSGASGGASGGASAATDAPPSTPPSQPGTAQPSASQKR